MSMWERLKDQLYSVKDEIRDIAIKCIAPIVVSVAITLTSCTAQPPANPPVVVNPVVEYAKSLGLSDNITYRLKKYGEGGMDNNERAFIDLLGEYHEVDKTFSGFYGKVMKMPELSVINEDDVKSTKKILDLASSTNPEVKEAFQLMLKGGTPNPNEFGYNVPDWNTELEVLYKIAEQNEFKKDDKLALAIAMDNGLYVTMGDDEVRQAVYKDVNDFLVFGRETSERQKALGLPYNLEEYPLEAEISWAWRGNYSAMSGRIQHLPSYKNKKLDMWAYQFTTIDKSSLVKMLDEIIKRRWDYTVPKDFISNLEWFFYFDRGAKAGNSSHWISKSGDETIVVDDKLIVNHDMSNADFVFDYFLRNGCGIGDCGDETTLIDALSKAYGIATDPVSYAIFDDNGNLYRHFYNIYFDPLNKTWGAYQGHTENSGYPNCFNNKQDANLKFFINRPPIYQEKYLSGDYTKPDYSGNTVYITDKYTISELKKLLLGFPTSDVKGCMFVK